MANEWDEVLLNNWGLDLPMLNDKDEQQEIEDLFNIELPFYTPSEDLPNVNDLADIKRTNTLNSKIDLLKIDEELKEILKIRASFFTDFNFQKIADYYAQQTYNGPSKVDYAVPTDFRSTFSVGLQTRPKKVRSETRDNVKRN